MSDSKMRLGYEDLKDKVDGRLHLSVLLQKRVRELMNGAPPLVQVDEGDYIDIALAEINDNKIALETGTDEEIEEMRIQERLQVARLMKNKKY